MSEDETFLSRWSRRKRTAEPAPETETPPAADASATPPAAPPAEEPAFDLSKLPSLDEIVAETDISVFMKPGVPAALRREALRRAWASDPAIRDFRGLQENDWDFNAPDGVPGFGTFKSDAEIKALAQRLFGPAGDEQSPGPHAARQDGAEPSAATAPDRGSEAHDEGQAAPPRAAANASEPDDAKAAQHDEDDEDSTTQRAATRRHGGALPR